MTALTDHPSSEFVKILYIGESGSGKTGSLVSLVKAGYSLRILDMDNGLDALRNFIKKECPERMSSVDYETRRDKMKMTAAGPQPIPKAFVQATQLLNEWSDGTKPETWGANTIFVLDSLTHLGRAAYNWAKGMNPGVKDRRQLYGMAQAACEDIISMLCAEDFRCNVILISHIEQRQKKDGTLREQVTAIGEALGPKVPTYFNTFVLAESRAVGSSSKKEIKTIPTATLDLKNPAPFEVEKVLPLETGMATLFESLKAAQ